MLRDSPGSCFAFNPGRHAVEIRIWSVTKLQAVAAENSPRTKSHGCQQAGHQAGKAPSAAHVRRDGTTSAELLWAVPASDMAPKCTIDYQAHHFCKF